MSRPPRILSESGLYHIIFRGINRQNIFEEKEDFEKLLETIKNLKTEMNFKLYAYCLMTNHVHLFIKENDLGDIKRIMHRLLTKYVRYFNYKYQRSGSLIGNRYKSEPIENDNHCLTLIRYIHQNPLKAGISNDIESYSWSSYNEYLKDNALVVDTDFMLSLFSEDKKIASNKFIEFHNIYEKEDFEISNTKKLTDEQIKRRIYKITGGISAEEISTKIKAERDSILLKLRDNGISIGELERTTGVSRGIITRAKQ